MTNLNLDLAVLVLGVHSVDVRPSISGRLPLSRAHEAFDPGLEGFRSSGLQLHPNP